MKKRTGDLSVSVKSESVLSEELDEPSVINRLGMTSEPLHEMDYETLRNPSNGPGPFIAHTTPKLQAPLTTEKDKTPVGDDDDDKTHTAKEQARLTDSK